MSLKVDIKKRLGDFSLDVSFENENEILALFGESGCGKSRTLKCIAGIEKPDSGKIVLNNRVLFDSEKKINIPPRERGVGYLFQNYALFPHMTVKKNIMSGIKGDRNYKESTAVQNIKQFHLEGMEDKFPSELSGGQQQRVALARIFASGPEVLLLDEPFSAMDSFLRWQLELELQNNLNNFKGPTVFVSHNRDEVYRLTGKVSVMKDGENERAVRTEALFENPDSLSSALLTGCKNYSTIEKSGTEIVFAKDWGEYIRLNKAPDENHRLIGIRAHNIKIVKEKKENTIECEVQKVIEDVFSFILMVRPVNSGSDSDYSKIRVEISKEKMEKVNIGDKIIIFLSLDDIIILR